MSRSGIVRRKGKEMGLVLLHGEKGRGNPLSARKGKKTDSGLGERQQGDDGVRGFGKFEEKRVVIF